MRALVRKGGVSKQRRCPDPRMPADLTDFVAFAARCCPWESCVIQSLMLAIGSAFSLPLAVHLAWA